MVVVVVTKDASHLVDGGSGCDQASGRGGCDQAWPSWPTLTGLLSVHFENSTTSSHNYICPLLVWIAYLYICFFQYLWNFLKLYFHVFALCWPVWWWVHCTLKILLGPTTERASNVWTFKCLNPQPQSVFQMFGDGPTTECGSNILPFKSEQRIGIFPF